MIMNILILLDTPTASHDLRGEIVRRMKKKNKKVVGKMKDELNGLADSGFVGFEPKLYSFAYYSRIKH